MLRKLDKMTILEVLVVPFALVRSSIKRKFTITN